jgi:hypothetical protein
MHPEALRGVQWALQDSGTRRSPNAGLVATKLRCLDVGGADVNGSARRIVDSATHQVNWWTGLDIEPGPGVDIVADARKPVMDSERGWYDFVLCTEVFEHVQDWSSIVMSIFDWLKPGGVTVMTCASTGRRPHGARGAMDPAAGEWYKNAPEHEVLLALGVAGFPEYKTRYQAIPGDCYAWARKGD